MNMTDQRIRYELKDLQDNPILNIAVTVGLPNPNNIYEWRCTISGPVDTPFGGGLFFLKIIFPKDYPMTKPEVCFITPIYHINVNPKDQPKEPLGHVCISTLNWWNPNCTIRQVLTDIFALFWLSNPDSPYGLERAEEMRKNLNLYNAKCKHYTQKYANMGNERQFTPADWNFNDPVSC